MSLSLDDVRRVRFRMARPRETGYAVADVDNFIDKVEESFAEFENNRDLMRRELDSAGGASFDSGELEKAREEAAAKDAELEELRQKVAELESGRVQASDADFAPPAEGGEDQENEQVARLQAANQQLEQDRERLEGEVERLKNELEVTRGELGQARTDRIAEVAGQPHAITVHAADDAAPAVTRLVQMATDQATTLVSEAEAEAARKLTEAEQRANEIKTDARTRAERIESEARVNAEQMTNDAQSRAQKLDSETEARRVELFADLEREQSELTGKVDSLRNFEGKYRENLGGSLQRLLEALQSDRPEPEDVPELAQQQSETPRLDALAEGEEQH